MRLRLSALLALVCFIAPVFAGDIPDPATLPEKVQQGDMDPDYPAECARRLLAGKALLDQGDLKGAQQEFVKAEQANSSQPMVYFYQAIVAYRLGDYPAALRKADTGLGVLRDVRVYGTPTPETDAQEKRIQELHDLIERKLAATGGKAGENPEEKKRRFADALAEGDQAYGQGLLAKAAAAYARAFRADPTEGETGLRAATLYADRLKNPLEAALLWQQVVAAGEPHATAARADLQSHREMLDAVLKARLDRLHQWNSTDSFANGVRVGKDSAEPEQLAAAFPESMELQVELAVLHAGNGSFPAAIAHLQSACRLGLCPDEFLAQGRLMEHLARLGLDAGDGPQFVTFVRDAFGDETLGKLQAELKRRVELSARLAREKTEKERKAALAKELKELSAWRNARRGKIAAEVNALISAHNNIEVEMAAVAPTKKKTHRNTITRASSLAVTGGQYQFTFWQRFTSVRLSSGVTSPTVTEDVVTLPSLASLSGIEVWPSSWESTPGRVGDANASIYSLPADPGQRAWCKEVCLTFASAVARCQRKVTYEYETMDGSRGYAHRTADRTVSIVAMLADADVARLRQFFGQLAKLDAAGNDVEKLRQLRAAQGAL